MPGASLSELPASGRWQRRFVVLRLVRRRRALGALEAAGVERAVEEPREQRPGVAAAGGERVGVVVPQFVEAVPRQREAGTPTPND
ncbi:hypothetical protein EGH21_05940 [Halomicroarcula sp. F13]|uniref:Uncharacterized protein n=1 Tax=Haloarcula rubra TaxID=2487747 RepID=A0AAW4PPV6_9EURY|nr:hypothetical protein [Halomicroarcula rubra]MBX0322565.1 hypothetical protein [Halomicroarcula rubra]